MNRNFQRALSAVLASEGGFVNDPRDPGGATNLGVTIGTARQLGIDIDRDGDTDVVDIKLLKPNDAAKVYKAEYWDAVKGDNLPDGLDYAVFDMAVLSGQLRASKILQTVLGVPADGKIGPATLSAASKANLVKAINDYNDQRLAFLRGLPTFATYGKGWTNRVASVRTLALQMAGTAPQSPPREPAPPVSTKPANKAGLIIVAVIVIVAIAFFIIKH